MALSLETNFKTQAITTICVFRMINFLKLPMLLPAKSFFRTPDAHPSRPVTFVQVPVNVDPSKNCKNSNLP